METEKLKIFDEQRNYLGVATREEVHKVGHWHETFHCWIVSKEEAGNYVYFQLRSPLKKDYPNLFDITAAGHLLANETVEDGVREVKEEIGLDVSMEDLHSLGVIPYHVQHGELIDKELAHVFLLIKKCEMEDFQLQVEEVAGIGKVRIEDFTKLLNGEKEKIELKGFQLSQTGERISLVNEVSIQAFVPHENSFYRKTFDSIKYMMESREINEQPIL